MKQLHERVVALERVLFFQRVVIRAYRISLGEDYSQHHIAVGGLTAAVC